MLYELLYFICICLGLLVVCEIYYRVNPPAPRKPPVKKPYPVLNYIEPEDTWADEPKYSPPPDSGRVTTTSSVPEPVLAGLWQKAANGDSVAKRALAEALGLPLTAIDKLLPERNQC